MRKALVALALLAVLALAGLWAAYNYLDVAVRAALEHWGPEVVGARVDVGEVEISPHDGRGSLTALQIGNPPGFQSGYAARVGRIQVRVDPATVLADVIVIRSLVVESLSITYEHGDGGANLERIQERIDAYARRSEAAASSGSPSVASRRRFIIERLEVRRSGVLVTRRGLRGQGIGVDLPELVMRDIGKREGGVSASRAAAHVSRELNQRILARTVSNIDALRRGGVGSAIEELLRRTR